MNGFLVIDKPGGMTSRDAVNVVQRWFPRHCKIGHTGTLDPLATGVLVLCIGQATRLADRVQAMKKIYRTQVLLGFTSDTDDADGTVQLFPEATPPGEDALVRALETFQGTILQIPPAFSALKQQGRRAHELARAGKTVTLEPRPVTVYDLRLDRYQWPFVELTIECGKGTYIRSIARDLGRQLGCGGIVQELRRTRVGPFTAEQGLSLNVEPSRARENLLPISYLSEEATSDSSTS